jgi:eukaryotic-like serine/threonine-protein kinase
VTLSRRWRWREWTAWAAAIALAAALGAVAWRFPQEPRRMIITAIAAPPKASLVFEAGVAVLSPDGDRIVYPAVTDGIMRLWLRQLDSEEARPLAGSDGAQFPFWSPDGKAIGFFADGHLKRIDADGGPAETLATAPTGRGGAWGPGGVILYAPSTSEPLFRVSAHGGDARPVTRLDVKRGENSHRFPAFAPDGNHFAVFAQGVASGNVLLGALDSPELRVLTTADANVLFAGDYLLYVRDRMLRAQRIDLKAGKLTGDPVKIAGGIQTSAAWNFSNYSVSSNGLLSYVTGSSIITRLRWVDREGKDLGVVTASADEHYDPRLLPDGKSLLFARAGGQAGLADVWIYDLLRNVPTRLTYAAANEFTAVPTPDGRYVAYVTFDSSPGDIFIKRTDGAGEARALIRDSRRKIPSDFSPDGRYLLYHAITPGRQWDMEKLSMEEKKASPILATPFAESGARFSPDGQWISYTSDESGKHEIYVQHFTDPKGKWQISDGGGLMSSWSSDGKEIYYYSPAGKMMVATVRTGKDFSADPARVLFPIRLAVFPGMTRLQYDVSRDGRFVVNAVASNEDEPLLITLVQNWDLKLVGRR